MLHVSDSSIHNDTKSQFAVVNAFLLAVFLILIGRLWYLQIFQGRKFRQFADENRIELKKIPSMRGKILDRNGTVIADSRPSFDLSLKKEHLENKDFSATLERLSKMLSWKEEELNRALKKTKDIGEYEEVIVKNDLSRDELAKFLVQQYAYPGVEVIHSPARSYPFSNHGSHLLGYLSEINKPELQKIRDQEKSNYELGDVVGIAGVEKRFDQELRGENGAEPIISDAKGRQLGVGLAEDLVPSFQPKDPVRGKDLVLAIDSRVQEAAEQAFEHESGAVVAMDPQTGDVLALLSKPEYEPEKFVRGVSADYWSGLVEDPLNPLYDRALRGLYPPGSTFKFITAIAALNEKVTQPEETVFCGGSYQLGRETKHCWNKAGHGWVNLHKAIAQSCDVYFYEMGRRLGVDRIAKYAKAFGLGQATKIGINRESDGLVPTEEWKRKVYHQPWVGGETLSIAIGQGYLQITPIQLAVALSALVNGGKVFVPRIALRTQGENGKDKKDYPVEVAKEVQTEVEIDPKTVEAVRQGLYSVVNDEQGTAFWSAKSKITTIAGKTGTAQTIGRNAGIRMADHAWFIAYAPHDNPRIVVSVIVEHGGHGGTTAAPIAKKIIETYLGGNS